MSPHKMKRVNPPAKTSGLFTLLGGLIFSALFNASPCLADEDYDEALQLYLKGEYTKCLRECRDPLEARRPPDEWFELAIKAQLAIGKYEDAYKTLREGLEKRTTSVRLRIVGCDVVNFAEEAEETPETFLEKIKDLVRYNSYLYRDTENRVALGKASLRLGDDPRYVLEVFYDPARKADPPVREAFLATGELALGKQDYAVAANAYRDGLKHFADDPDILHGLATSLANSDREQMGALINQALETNPKHVPSLLLLVDNMVDAEEYESAEELLDEIFDVNPDQPEAWAYKAVLAHLVADEQAEQEARENALKHWEKNPEVDHLIGLKLSQKYRFNEGSAYQRKALASKPGFLKSQLQLAQDLLRLGDEAEGWNLAELTHDQDEYNATAFNLITLRSTIDKFITLTNDTFILRMDADEAFIYGDRALALLEEAKDVLTEKYELELTRPVTVEIFPNQDDFGVRTFGMPHNPGFLGVCFGNVITANSPASAAGNNSNWEAVLWHEFCHVITLNMTKNKMPRWLSEGISVFEEMKRNPAWGQSMSPEYRQRILGDKMTPVGALSAAFMHAETGEDMQFAYYQSSLVVEFIAQEYGIEALKAILRELGEGIEMNETLAKHTTAIDDLETEFETFAKDKARKLGEGLNWDLPADERIPANVTEGMLASNPMNYYLLLEHAKSLLQDQKWEEAMVPLNTLLEHFPDQEGTGGALFLQSVAYRGLGDFEQERKTLERFARIDADSTPAYLRLIEMAEAEDDWDSVALNAQRILAVNPLVPHPHRFLAKASEAVGDTETAITAYRNVLRLNPADPAEAHFRLARLLHQEQEPTAKQHLLMALEEAPRFREAHRLLLTIRRSEADSIEPPQSPEPNPAESTDNPSE